MARISRVQALLNLTPDELMNMSRRDMARNISVLASAANKRIVRLEKSGVRSPALDFVKTHGGKFSVAGKTQNQLLIEYFRLQQFMSSKTSTVRGAKSWKLKVKKAVEKAVLIRLAPNDKDGKINVRKMVQELFDDPQKEQMFWDLYSRLVEEYDVKEKYEKVWNDIAQAMKLNPRGETDDLFEMLSKEYEEKYQQNAPKDSGNELFLSDDVKKATKEIITGEVL